MTQDDVDIAVGRAVRELRDVEKKIACLELRLRMVGKALSAVVDNPVHEESNQILDNAADPLVDWASLKAAHDRRRELQRIVNS